MHKRVRLVVSGRVQGVCFRMCARDVAESLGLVGWVRNRSDGTVELVAEGEECALSALLEWCRRGPSRAEVSDVEVVYSEPHNEFHAFRIGF